MSWKSPRAGALSFRGDWKKMTLEKKVARLVCAVRLKQNLTQAQLAAKAGKTRAALAKMESRGIGYWDPWPCRALGLDFHKLRDLAQGKKLDKCSRWELADAVTAAHQVKSHKGSAK